ncbi:Werner helicase interacting protein 1 [Elysia marginata]|uniref:Werner helicase interacting protein 1 n=1 Tax=Elysia marginata TaxID=1093978 RepID=A0AAV4J172_9GAST|nr:Werner helicase interacting protein 1 [Elysia marginata]
MSSTVECPVCHICFASSVISAHVNSCLNDHEESTEAQSGSKKRPCENGHGTPCSSKSTKLFDMFKSRADPLKQHQKSYSPGSGVKIKSVRAEGIVIDSDTDSDTEIESKKSKTSTNSKGSEKKSVKELSKKSEETSSYKFPNEYTKVKGKHHTKNANVPLAAKMRPSAMEDFVGQSQAVKKNSLLFNVLSLTKNVPSMILWGPPGCGKTTLASIVGENCKRQGQSKFVSMSATSASVNDIKQVAIVAANDMKMLRRKTILFLDEIHRFNKLQQDTLLPHVENGTLTLIGATTENPSFHVNSALLSRCKVLVLEKLSVEDMKIILQRAICHLGIRTIPSADDLNGSDVLDSKDGIEGSSPLVVMEEEAVDMLANVTDGDARSALNGLQLAWEGCLATARQESSQAITINADLVKEALQRSHILYDKTGEEHFNTVSAMIKSLRGSDADAALYWMVRMLEGGENPLFIARRLVIFASEDIGLSDSQALTHAVSTHQACHILGMPECALNLTHCVLYLARAPKSAGVLKSLTAARDCIRQHVGALPSVPLHLRNSSSNFQHHLGYKYPPDYKGTVQQDYLPPCLKGMKFVDS